jgi:predicted transposase YbfD/YdcC
VGIETSLHWVLNIAFHEHSSRKRAENATENFSIIYRIALNLVKNETSKKKSIKGKWPNVEWNMRLP